MHWLAALTVFAALAGSTPALAANDAVNESVWVPVTNGRVYVLMRGANSRAPLLLWLHGGPGGAERPLFRLFNSALEQQFVVAYWDQRGAGRSYDSDADPAALTVAQHLDDLERVVRYLRDRFQQPKVSLIGHSWGSALGLLFARDHAAQVSAFVSVGQVVATVDNQRAQLAFVASEAVRRDELSDWQAARADIGDVPFGWPADLALQQWVDRYGGVFHRPPNRVWSVLTGMAKGYVSPLEIYRIIRANNASLAAMNAELKQLDLRNDVHELHVPWLMMLGRFDRVTDTTLAVQLFDQMQCQDKSLVWFEHSAHNAPFEEPERFNEVVGEFVNERLRPTHVAPE